MKTRFHFILTLACMASSAVAQDGAGPLIPPTGPQNGTYRTLGEIWDKLEAIQSQNDALTVQNSQLNLQVQVLTNQLNQLPLDTTRLLMKNLQQDLPWQFQVVDPSEASGYVPELVFSPAGDPAIASLQADGDDLVPVFSTRINGVWQSVVVDAGVNTYAGSLAFNAQGYPGILYMDEGLDGLGDEQLKLAEFDGTTWNISVVHNERHSGKLRYGSDGLARVVTNTNSGITPGLIVYMVRDGSGWQRENMGGTPGVAASGVVGNVIDFELDALDQPVVAWSSGILFDPASLQLHVAAKVAGVWNVDAYPAISGVILAKLELDSDGLPHLAYLTQDFRYRRWSAVGENWVEYLITESGNNNKPQVGSGFGFKLGALDQPMVCYPAFGIPERGVFLSKFSGVAWESESLGTPLFDLSNFAFALQPNGEPAFVGRRSSVDGVESQVYGERALITTP